MSALSRAVAFLDWTHGVKKIPKDEAREKIKAAVLEVYPHWDGSQDADDTPMPEDVYEAVYWLMKCTVCDDLRAYHLRGWKAHLIPYGGTG